MFHPQLSASLGVVALMLLTSLGLSAAVAGAGCAAAPVSSAKFEVPPLGLSYDVSLTTPRDGDGYGVFTGPRYETDRKLEDYGTAIMDVSTPRNVVFRKLSAEVVEFTDGDGAKFWVIANGDPVKGYAVSVLDAKSAVVARGDFTGPWSIDEGQGGAQSIPAFAAYLFAATTGTPRPPTCQECEGSAPRICGGQMRFKSVEYTVKPDGTVTCKVDCKD
jgi:hypothetical protein